MITLFVGRFQPFHIGHLHDIKTALDFSESIKIAIGSSQEKNTGDNPFSFDERREMIEEVLRKENIENFEIFAVPDINDDSEWVDHVKSIVGTFNSVYTGNEKVRKLFEDRHHVKEVHFLHDVNATEIRKRIQKDANWKELVPKEIIKYLEKINGVQRIKKINGSSS